MIVVKVKKVWNGMVAIRDKYVAEAVKNKEGIEITHEQDAMVIPSGQLLKQIAAKSETPFFDKYAGESHYLYYFDWLPRGKVQKLW